MTCKHLVGGKCALGLLESPTPDECASCFDNTDPSPEIAAMQRAGRPPNLVMSFKGVYTAITTSISARVSDDVANQRRAACMSCPSRWPGDQHNADPVGWCKSCGCGTGALAALSVKVTKSGARCPKSLWP